MKYGVIGLGTVGYPLFKALDFYHGEDNVFGYDVKKEPSHTWEHILRCNMVFLCLPTDKGTNGELDTRIVDSVLHKLEADKYEGIVVIKSTCGWNYDIRARIKHYDFTIIIFPEWLYADNTFPDTLKPEMVVIGADYPKDFTEVNEACPWISKIKNTFYTTPEEAVVIKSVANATASTKISLANSVLLLCEERKIDGNRVMEILRKDPRVAPRYLEAGRPYGGYCLPKDTSDTAHCSSKAILFKAVEEVNEMMKKREGERGH